MGDAGTQQGDETLNFPPCEGQDILQGAGLRLPRPFPPHPERPSHSHPRSTGLDVPRVLESLIREPNSQGGPMEMPLPRADLCVLPMTCTRDQEATLDANPTPATFQLCGLREVT